MKRRIAVLLMILGVAAAVLGVLSATVWRASNVVTMTSVRGEAPVLTTDPGVLTMMDGEVSVTATADDGQPVTMIIDRTAAVDAWVAGSPHTAVTGASDWDTLSTEEKPAAEGATETVPSPTEADGWDLVEQQDGSLSTTWTPTEGSWSVLAVTDGSAPAPSLTLSWQREVTTPWLWPGVAAGLVLVLVGVVLLALDSQDRRRREERRKRREARTSETTVIPAVGEDGRPVERTSLSRRARREEEGR